MGKSTTGGTRAYIRGRVGSDVYSIGKDGKGKKQQVVRSLAETVANPQTQSQMQGRMIMSTVMQALATLRPIVDHSFDGVSGKQPNISEFISRNYGLIKADIAAHPSSGNLFGLVKYQEKGAKQGQYVISDGEAQLPASIVLTPATAVITITLDSDAITVAGLKAKTGLATDEYFTLVGLKSDGLAAYERFRVNPSLADSTAITSDNIGSVFAVEGNAAATMAVASNVITITLSAVAGCCAVILSKKTTNGYIHNKAQLGDGTAFDFNSDAAFPTYPIGAADYLNGGDIFGQQESFNPGGDVPPTPSPTTSAISGVTINGVSLAQSGSATLTEGSNSGVVTISQGTDGKTYKVGIADKATFTVGHAEPQSGLVTVASSTVNVSVTAATADAAKAVVLCVDGLVTQVWGTLNAPSPAPSEDYQLTALSVWGTSILDPSSKYDHATEGNNNANYTLNVAPAEGANLNLIAASGAQVAVGAEIPSAQIKQTSPLSTQTGTASVGSNYYEGAKYRIYLCQGSTVLSVHGEVEMKLLIQN